MSGALVVGELYVQRGPRTVVRGLNVTVAPGEICALMGVSGAGKSTVLRAIAALEPIGAGVICVGNVTLEMGPLPPESRLRGLRRQIGVVFQSPSLFENMTALQNVMLAPVHTLGWSHEKAEEVARRLLSSLGVGERADAYPRQLSGGEAQRVAIARALAPDPTFLLMDEPTSALDPARRGALGDALRGLAREGRGLLIATHDVEFALSYADRVAVMHAGHIVEEGATATVLRSPSQEATRELLNATSPTVPRTS